ncbi:zinc transporter ZIP11-like, partial [Saccoglossus kowalevskii]|uniref:Zinc transporter ZIP11 n=1 Tax=Saccoglossus kowalevskii TaxID=10224 RepID=A0ABM0GSS0_SACKO
RKVLDCSLGFAAGVMLAASYWSLLAPAIELAELSGYYGDEGQWSFIPSAIGFGIGALFVYFADWMLPYLGVCSPNIALALEAEMKHNKEDSESNTWNEYENSTTIIGLPANGPSSTTQRRRPGLGNYDNSVDINEEELSVKRSSITEQKKTSWRRIVLLIIAITIHNIPEGLAVGVGFGAIGKTPSATFENARNLAIGIGIQNFPEGLAVSLPLRGSGYSTWKSFW